MARYMREGRKITKSLDSSLPVPTGSNSVVEKIGGEMLNIQPGGAWGFVPLDSVSKPRLKLLFLGIPTYNFSATFTLFFFLKGSKIKVNFFALICFKLI